MENTYFSMLSQKNAPVKVSILDLLHKMQKLENGGTINTVRGKGK